MRAFAISGLTAGFILLLFAGWQFNKLRKLSLEVESLNAESFINNLKSTADDLFISGRTEEALEMYRKYDSLTLDSMEITRYSQARAMSNSQDSIRLAKLQAQLDRTSSLLRTYENIDSPTAEIVIVEAETDKRLELQIQILEQSLMASNKEIEKLKTGKGVIQFSSSKNGSVTYLGDLLNGKANGKGYGLWKSGSAYDGNWKDNMRHGEGVFIWADGEKYEGEYQNDQRHGYGVYVAKAGRYEGQWKEDMRHGEGKLYEANGKFKLQGIWEKDKLVTTVK